MNQTDDTPLRSCLIRYRVDSEDAIPVAVRCVKVGYPHVDEDRHIQYANTHFDEESAAWEQGLSEVRSGVALAEGDVRAAQATLARAEARLERARGTYETFMIASAARRPELREIVRSLTEPQREMLRTFRDRDEALRKQHAQQPDQRYWCTSLAARESVRTLARKGLVELARDADGDPAARLTPDGQAAAVLLDPDEEGATHEKPLGQG